MPQGTCSQACPTGLGPATQTLLHCAPAFVGMVCSMVAAAQSWFQFPSWSGPSVSRGCHHHAPSTQAADEARPAGFGFYSPYWLVIIANLAIVVHLIGGYQVWTQPFLMAVESKVEQLFPNSRILKAGFNVPAGRNKVWHVRYYILVWRSVYVVFTTIIAILAPFFNDIVGARASAWHMLGWRPRSVHDCRIPIACRECMVREPPWNDGQWGARST